MGSTLNEEFITDNNMKSTINNGAKAITTQTHAQWNNAKKVIDIFK